ncbi:O-methyltransferase [Mycena filopes]|nr:O-methyltransferase [Mycena filopes]
MASTLIQLSNLISSSVATIDARCKALSRSYPDLDTPGNDTDGETVLTDPEVIKATSVALAAASQLIYNINRRRRPSLRPHLRFSSPQQWASLLPPLPLRSSERRDHRSGNPSKNGMDAMKIARVLRPLATQHIFREVSPDVFAHNRISILLDTGKSSKEVLDAPEDKFHGAVGYAALIGLNTDETFKAAAYIEDVVLDPQKRQDADELDTPLNRAFGTHVDLFSWYELPGNRVRFRRFGMAMDASRRVSPTGWVLQGFNWSSLPDGTLIVDVGGGIGSISLDIAKGNPQLRFVIQDKAAVAQEGEEPVTDADVYLLRFICHDWSDSYTRRILKHLRDAAQSSTKLIVIERIIPFVCGEDTAYQHIPGAVPAIASPEPLLANMGAAVPYLIDMQMMALLSGCERTFPHYVRLFAEAGWEIEEVYRTANSMDQILARPI